MISALMYSFGILNILMFVVVFRNLIVLKSTYDTKPISLDIH